MTSSTPLGIRSGLRPAAVVGQREEGPPMLSAGRTHPVQELQQPEDPGADHHRGEGARLTGQLTSWSV